MDSESRTAQTLLRMDDRCNKRKRDAQTFSIGTYRLDSSLLRTGFVRDWTGIVVAGGHLVNNLMRDEVALLSGDVDVFFVGESVGDDQYLNKVYLVYEWMREWYPDTKYTANMCGITLVSQEHCVKVQLIGFASFVTVWDLLYSFDLSNCQFAYDGLFLYATPWTMDYLRDRTVRYWKDPSGYCSEHRKERIAKYGSRPYNRIEGTEEPLTPFPGMHEDTESIHSWYRDEFIEYHTLSRYTGHRITRKLERFDIYSLAEIGRKWTERGRRMRSIAVTDWRQPMDYPFVDSVTRLFDEEIAALRRTKAIERTLFLCDTIPYFGATHRSLHCDDGTSRRLKALIKTLALVAKRKDFTLALEVALRIALWCVLGSYQRWRFAEPTESKFTPEERSKILESLLA